LLVPRSFLIERRLYCEAPSGPKYQNALLYNVLVFHLRHHLDDAGGGVNTGVGIFVMGTGLSLKLLQQAFHTLAGCVAD